MKYVILSVLLLGAGPAFAQEKTPENAQGKVCVDATSGGRYNARPISQHEVLARNAIGPEKRAAVLGTTCIHIYAASTIALHSLTQCIGLGDDVGVSTMGGPSERCKVTKVTPAAETYADAKYR
ncbi:MAG TPA: hypothetical protein VIG39_05580 [Rhizomicrobium sp.]